MSLLQIAFFQTHGTQRNRNPRVVEVSSKLISRLDVGGSHITTLISPDETFNKQFKTSTQAAQSLPETRCDGQGADVTLAGGCVAGNCNTSRPPSKVTVAFDSTQRHTRKPLHNNGEKCLLLWQFSVSRFFFAAAAAAALLVLFGLSVLFGLFLLFHGRVRRRRTTREREARRQ